MSATEVVGTAKEGVETAQELLELYERLVNNAIPWDVFDDSVKNLKQAKEYYSNAAGKIIGNISTLLLDSQDDYLSSQDEVYGWCNMASPLLGQYMRQFAGTLTTAKANVQKVLLMKVLDEGEKQISDAKEKLEKSRKSFNNAYGELDKLSIQFNNDFTEGSAYFNSQAAKLRIKAYAGAAAGVVWGPVGLLTAQGIAAAVVEGKLIPEMKRAFAETQRKYDQLSRTVDKARDDIQKAKQAITDELFVLTKIKSQIQTSGSFAETWALVPEYLFNDLKTEVNKLIRMCDNYVDAVDRQRSR